VSEKEIVKELPKIIYYFDQPTGGSFENYFISKITSGKVKVALSGLGSDELFAGYHAMVYKYRFLSGLYKNIPGKLHNLVLGLSNLIMPNEDMKKTLTVADKFLSLPNTLKKRLFLYFAFDEAEKRKLYSKSYLSKTKKYDTDILFDKLFEKVKDRNPIDQLGYIDLNTYTRDDLLLGTNMMSMANSLEVRVPFLDKELVEFSYTIPSKYKYKNGISKYILRDIAKKWLPQEVINHKKIGFGLPRVQYMNGCLKPYILSCLSPQSVKKRGIFDEKFVNETVNQFYNHKSTKRLWNEHLRVWLLFVLEIWFRIYIDDSDIEVPSYSLLDMS
jgi:asparagine synthase (glutamine-hydrolysing)